ncbi:MAG: mshG [Panacagrimonas sp.]|nr:type II secretion system F family protein [Panacagrimonas sp.]MCC2656159.1 mshG [Panacagrimonas sp.]
MILYRFKGRDRQGRPVSGEVRAENAAAVAAQLVGTGVTPIRIEAGVATGRGALPAFLRTEIFTRNPGIADLMLFARQMYSLTRSGVPLVRALRGLAESSRHPVMVRTLEDVVQSLGAGRDLASALARHPKVFSPLFVNVVRVGENSGKLDEAFLRLYHYLAFDANTRAKVAAALRYPVIVLVAVAVAIGVIMTMVVPQFARAFKSFGAQLPWPTQVIIAVSDFTVNYWYLLLGGLVLAIFAGRSALATPQGRLFTDRLKLRLPVLGSIVLRATLARFARSFAIIVRAGVPLMDGLVLVGRAVQNEVVADKVRTLREAVERGENLSRAAAASGMFTPLVLQMLSVGEETGRIDEMMEEVADYYDREVAADVDNLASLIEPLLIIVVGGVVLLLALAVFLPMWDLSGAALKRN